MLPRPALLHRETRMSTTTRKYNLGAVVFCHPDPEAPNGIGKYEMLMGDERVAAISALFYGLPIPGGLVATNDWYSGPPRYLLARDNVIWGDYVPVRPQERSDAS